MHKLMCTFVVTTKKKKIPDRNLDTACPAGIPCNYTRFSLRRKQRLFLINFSFWKALCVFLSIFIEKM